MSMIAVTREYGNFSLIASKAKTKKRCTQPIYSKLMYCKTFYMWQITLKMSQKRQVASKKALITRGFPPSFISDFDADFDESRGFSMQISYFMRSKSW